MERLCKDVERGLLFRTECQSPASEQSTINMELEADAEMLAAALSFVDEALAIAADGSEGVLDTLPPLVALGSLVAPSNVDGEWSPSGGGGTLAALGEAASSGGDGDLSARQAALDAECSSMLPSSGASESVDDDPRDSVKAKPVEKKRTRKRPADYNPNRAREEQRKEVRALRSEVGSLEEQLAVLDEARPRHCGAVASGLHHVDESDSIASNVWKALAERQLQKRVASTSENVRLKAALQANQAMIARVSRIIRSHNAEKVGALTCANARCMSVANWLGCSSAAGHAGVLHRAVAQTFRAYTVPGEPDDHPTAYGGRRRMLRSGRQRCPRLLCRYFEALQL